MPYSMLESYMDTISDGSNHWNYANEYKVNGGSVKAGVPDSPLFTVADMTAGDKEIVLYFKNAPIVTVQYREYRNTATDRENSQLLFNELGKNKENYVLSSTPLDLLTKETVANAIKYGTESVIGKKYKIYKGWSEDGGVNVNGPEVPLPKYTSDNNNNKDIVMYFSTQYVVLEQYMSDSGVKLIPDDYNTFETGEDFTGNPPSYVNIGSDKWVYKGYIIEGDYQDPTTTGNPTVANIAGDFQVIYIYEIDGRSDGSFIVINRWYLLGTPTVAIEPNVVIPYEGPGAYIDDIKDYSDYDYKGWVLDDEDLSSIRNGKPSDYFSGDIEEFHVVTYIYQVKADSPDNPDNPDNPNTGDVIGLREINFLLLGILISIVGIKAGKKRRSN